MASETEWWVNRAAGDEIERKNGVLDGSAGEKGWRPTQVLKVKIEIK